MIEKLLFPYVPNFQLTVLELNVISLSQWHMCISFLSGDSQWFETRLQIAILTDGEVLLCNSGRNNSNNKKIDFRSSMCYLVIR